MSMESERNLFLIMTDRKYRYCLYRIGDKQVSTGDETSIRNLEKPVLKMKKSKFPNYMEFTAIGSCIFMVGGHSDGVASSKVFIYDVASTQLNHGPNLNSGKVAPFLITLGSKLFVLSHNLYCGEPRSDSLDRVPLFEVLDTVYLNRGWTSLPAPSLRTSSQKSRVKSRYSVTSCAAVFISGRNGVIFISGDDGGTYAYDVDREEWNYVSNQVLPFYGQAMAIPNEPSCFANSLKSGRYATFRFCYGGDEEYRVEEIDMTASPVVFPPLPSLTCFRPMITVLSSDGNRVYLVMTGVDKALSYHNSDSNRYVKVNALELSIPNLALNDTHTLRRCDKAKSHMQHDEGKHETSEVDMDKELTSTSRKKTKMMRQAEKQDALELSIPNLALNDTHTLRRCDKAKSHMQHDEGKHETSEVDMDKELTSTSRKKKKKMMRQAEEQGEEETKELTMSSLWRACFSGGPVCDELIHVAGALAM